MQTKIEALLFAIPFIGDVAIKYFKGEEITYTATLVIIAVVACFIGAAAQIADTNSKRTIKRAEVYAIIGSSLLIGFVAIEVGRNSTKIAPWVNVICVLGSFWSLALLTTIKNAFLRLINMLPDFAKMYFKHKWGLTEKDKNNEEDYE